MSESNALDPSKRSLPRCRLLLVALVLLSLHPLVARAQDDPRLPKFVGVEVGFNRMFKLGAWTPVDILIQGGTQPVVGRLSVVVPDGDDIPTRVFMPDNRPIQITAGGQVAARMYVKFGRQGSDLPVELQTQTGDRIRGLFETGNQPGIEVPYPLAAEQSLLVNVGPSIGVRPDMSVDGRLNVADLVDTRNLPTKWIGYEGVDTLILSVTRADAFSSLRPGTAEHEALHEWLEMGGRLVLCVGSTARDVLTPDGPLARFVPGTFDDMGTLSRADALETFSDSSERVPSIGRSRDLQLTVPKLSNLRGRVILEDQDLPLIVRAPYGFGEVVFVGLDLGQPPLSAWKGRMKFVHRLLDLDDTATTSSSGQAHGITDLSGQLRAGLDRFVGVTVVPFWIVGGLIFLYILAIGPGDYLLVRRVLKRMELTWITFPTMVILVCVGAYLAARITKGDRLLVNQVDVIDVDGGSGAVRGTSWLNVFSPSTSSYDLRLEPSDEVLPGAASAEMVFSWFGQPGSGWGGMQSAGGPALFNRAYEFSPNLAELIGTPIDIWGTKSFTARWRAKTAVPVDSKLSLGADRTLRGELTSRLSVPLEDCALLFDRWAYPIGTLAPGKTFEAQPGEQRDLAAVLKSYEEVRNAKNTGFVQQGSPWRPYDTDVAKVVQLMLFYQASDGKKFTGLANGMQGFVDMSDTLQAGRAVLVGRALSDRAATTLLDGDRPMGGENDLHWTFYRFVFEVADNPHSDAESP